MLVTPIIMSTRLVLRPICERDALILQRGINTPEINRWMINLAPLSVDDVLSWITMAPVSSYYWMICDKYHMLPTGCLTLDWNEAHHAYEIGWWLLPEFWHKGYITEAVHHMLFWATAALSGKKIIGIVARDNAVCIRALERVGFTNRGNSSYAKSDGTKIFPAYIYQVDL